MAAPTVRSLDSAAAQACSPQIVDTAAPTVRSLDSAAAQACSPQIVDTAAPTVRSLDSATAQACSPQIVDAAGQDAGIELAHVPIGVADRSTSESSYRDYYVTSCTTS